MEDLKLVALWSLKSRHPPRHMSGHPNARRAFAAKLKAKGKPAKVVLNAIMRKLIVIMNAVLKEGQASNRYGAA